MKQSRFFLFFALLCIAFVWAGCNDNGGVGGDGKIPFDERRAELSVISIDTAKRYQANFINSRETLKKMIGDTSYLGKNFNLPNAETFTRDAIILLLNQTGQMV